MTDPFTTPPPRRLPQRQELESENKKLKHDLAEMRQSLLRDGSASSAAPGSPAYKVLLEQLNASCEELDVRKEEVLILRSQLVSQKEALHHKVEPWRRCCSVRLDATSLPAFALIRPCCRACCIFTFVVLLAPKSGKKKSKLAFFFKTSFCVSPPALVVHFCFVSNLPSPPSPPHPGCLPRMRRYSC